MVEGITKNLKQDKFKIPANILVGIFCDYLSEIRIANLISLSLQNIF
jgi:hypothetical protein